MGPRECQWWSSLHPWLCRSGCPHLFAYVLACKVERNINLAGRELCLEEETAVLLIDCGLIIAELLLLIQVEHVAPSVRIEDMRN